ncbi:MAG: DUF222 domain-containing protein, partial [Ilumatobacter sp.]|nr:DUF222 domain-containing protein [Ilumatobacter sp.]
MELTDRFSGASVATAVGSMPYPAQVARLRELEALRRRVEAELAATVHAVGEAKLFGEDGHSSVRAVLRAEANMSEGEISHLIRTGRLLDDMPQVVDALGSGVRRCVRRWEMLADFDGAHQDDELAHETRQAGLTIRDGVGHLSGHGGALDSAELKEIWDQFTQAEFLNDLDIATASAAADGASTDLPRNAGQRRWDALLRIFRTAAGAPAGTKEPEPVLNLIMDAQTFEDVLTRDWNLLPTTDDRLFGEVPQQHRRSETSTGVLVDPQHALRAAIGGWVRRVVVDSAGNIIDYGRRRRLFTGAARDAVMLHSPRCTWAGCDTSTTYCNADHTTDWQHGGQTTTTNGAPLCPRHDRLKNHGYRLRRDPNGTWHTY